VKVILLPVKDPSHAKQRLATLLSPEERSQLAWTMLKDVSRALAASKAADRIVVVAHDPSVIQYALEQSWEVVREREQISESHSVDQASSWLQRQGATVVLRLPGDIPLLQAEDLDLLLKIELPSGSALLVPSRDGLGTNALLRTLPAAFPSRFGRNSFRLHQEEAQRAGVTMRVIENPRIALDLDEVSDLALFWEQGQETSTTQLIQKMGLVERLLQWEKKINATS
jgi:2-phospho-L-lactate/phosphoenolpyruvate guanylyltransferase